MPIKTLTVKQLPVNSLIEHPDNARRGDIESIKESLEAHGQYKPIVVQESTNYVLAGNHTLRAATALGWKRIAASVIDVDDATARKILLVDNRTSDLGAYDEAELTALLNSLDGDLLGTGYEEGDLNARLAALTSPNISERGSALDHVDNWQANDARTIQISLTVAQHAVIVERLDLLADQMGVDTYTECIVKLVMDATS